MDLHELRGRLAKRLRREDVSDDVWDYLDIEGWVRDAALGSHEDFDAFVEQVRRLLRLVEKMPRGVSAPPNLYARDHAYRSEDGRDYALSEYETERSWAVAKALWLDATGDADVRRFQQEILGGHWLKESEARALTSSAAIRLLSLAEFREFDIPIVGHRAAVHESSRERKDDGDDVLRVDLEISWERGRQRKKIEFTNMPPSEELAKLYVDAGAWIESETWIPEHRAFDSLPVRPGSVGDDLRGLAESLAARYGWFQSEATQFLTTGACPPSPPIRVDTEPFRSESRSLPRIVITAEAWMPAETVLRAYRETQHDVLSGKNRPIGLKQLKLVQFVADDKVSAPSALWHERMERWNEDNAPNWPYENVRLFSRDFDRTKDALLSMRHPWPHWVDSGSDPSRGSEWV